jgi:hypothetical protein
MKKILGVVFVCVLLLAAGPAFADKASQLWKCEMDNEVHEDDVIVMAKAWIKLAKSVEGGENLKGYLRFPVAVNMMGDSDFFLELVFPTFVEWGKFWDNYSGSEAAVMEDANAEAGVVCPDSAVWEIDSLH